MATRPDEERRKLRKQNTEKDINERSRQIRTVANKVGEGLPQPVTLTSTLINTGDVRIT
jgi:hypothetical protein